MCDEEGTIRARCLHSDDRHEKKKKERRFIRLVKAGERCVQDAHESRVSHFENNSFFFLLRCRKVQRYPAGGENLSRRKSDVTARCRVTVYSESRISRRYLIDPLNAKEKSSRGAPRAATPGS